MLKITQISNDVIKTVFADLLKQWVGPHRKLSVAECADITGISLPALESYRKGQAAPPLENTLKILSAVGEPSFVNSVLALIGFTGARFLEMGENNPFLINGEIASLVHHLSDALRDQRIDHVEARQLAPRVKEAMEQLSSFYFHLSETIEPKR